MADWNNLFVAEVGASATLFSFLFCFRGRLGLIN